MKNIIARLFWQSPFEALHRHMLKVKECTDMLKPLIEAFILGDRTLIEERVERISKLEHEADIIKNEIREHLPHHVFMPVDRSDILRFLREEDAIADSVEDVARLIEMRKTSVPQDLKEELMELVNKVGETVKALENVTSEIKVLSQSSFSRSEEEKISSLIKDVDKKEFEADLLQQKAAKKLFSLEDKMDPTSVLLLMRIMGEVGSVADHAQNTGDRLRCIIAR
ncbi:TIGR00153 family protein [Candidatus Aerophobetes bacterium]|uniref:TIGR00153 family protein n=1 Tax=Aerophobetes bacterium TaxID=2030807 RepID=A0A497E6I5_UNCAE|nr:MAG: TIGR00153 family protein [Candidatus Aerophobetes bacterium]